MKDELDWQWKQEKKKNTKVAFVNNGSWMSNDERWMMDDKLFLTHFVNLTLSFTH